MKIDYDIYLKSEEWLNKKIQFYHSSYYNGCCFCCGTKENKRHFHIHHLTYDRVGHENLEDLVALCKDCHTLIHEKLKFTKSDDIKGVTLEFKKIFYEQGIQNDNKQFVKNVRKKIPKNLKKEKRKETKAHLLDKQNYKCALTGWSIDFDNSNIESNFNKKRLVHHTVTKVRYALRECERIKSNKKFKYNLSSKDDILINFCKAIIECAGGACPIR